MRSLANSFAHTSVQRRKSESSCTTMKKLFSILAIAGVMAACNNSTDSGKTTTDSTTMSTDTTSKMSTDTNMNKMSTDTTNKMPTDTSKKK